MSINNSKYAYPNEFVPKHRRWPDKKLEISPAWCSVDLRDGNQALPRPMEPEQKKAFFKMLVAIGFKEIEIGFPAASTEEWSFCRELIKQDLIPNDVRISVLTQARDHVIRKTMSALNGIKTACCHIYIPTSELHTRYVLRESRNQVMKRAISSVRLVKSLAEDMSGNVSLEFSPEEFTDTDLDFSVELCDAVVDAWGSKDKVIINLPLTVERSLPTHYADMIESFIEKSSMRSRSIISVHAHNDMGSAVAATELALLAGAQRVEGTLFGNGERAGNSDIVTLALNLQYLGIDTGLDFGDIESIEAKYSELTSMSIHPRQPYSGSLIFTAFSGSHQDAIGKCLDKEEEIRKRFGGWKMPYLHINPEEIGRSISGTIRINSQSGKGGLAYVLSESYNVRLPDTLLAELETYVQHRTEELSRELRPDEIWDLLVSVFCVQESPIMLLKYWPRPDSRNPSIIHSEVHLKMRGKKYELTTKGDGPVAAFANALRQLDIPKFKLLNYEERSIGVTVDADSITIVTLENADGKLFHGIGFGSNIVQGAAKAIVSAINRIMLTD